MWLIVSESCESIESSECSESSESSKASASVGRLSSYFSTFQHSSERRLQELLIIQDSNSSFDSHVNCQAFNEVELLQTEAFSGYTYVLYSTYWRAVSLCVVFCGNVTEGEGGRC